MRAAFGRGALGGDFDAVEVGQRADPEPSVLLRRPAHRLRARGVVAIARVVLASRCVAGDQHPPATSARSGRPARAATPAWHAETFSVRHTATRSVICSAYWPQTWVPTGHDSMTSAQLASASAWAAVSTAVRSREESTGFTLRAR